MNALPASANPEAPRCQIICGDSRQELLAFTHQVDLIMTSPPYADARKRHYDSIRPEDYPDWFASFHEPFWQALKPTGSLVINIKDKVVNGVRLCLENYRKANCLRLALH